MNRVVALSIHSIRLIVLSTLFVIPLLVRVNASAVSEELGNLRFTWPLNVEIFSWWRSQWVLGASLLILFPLSAVLRKSRSVPKPLLVCGGVYVVAVFFSALLSDFPEISFDGFPGLYEGAYALIGYFVLALAAAVSFSTKTTQKQFVWVLYGTTFLLCLVGLHQVFRGCLFLVEPFRTLVFGSDEVAKNFSTSIPNLFATLFHSNYVGSFVSLILPFFFSLALSQKGWVKLTYGGLSLLLFAVLTASGSRAGLLGVLCGVILVGGMKVRQKARLRGFMAASLLLVVMGAALALQRTTVFRKKLEAAFTEMNPTRRNAIEHFSVDKGKVRLVYEGKGLLLTRETTGIKIASLAGEPLPLQSTGNVTRIPSRGYEFFKASFLEAPVIGPYVNLSMGEHSINLVGTPKGLQALVWKGALDSDFPRKFSLFSEDYFLSQRAFVWARTIPLLSDHMFLGGGPGTFALEFPQKDFFGKFKAGWPAELIVDRPHSFYLQVAQSTGIISLLALLSLFWLVLKGAVSSCKLPESYFVEALTVGIVGYLVTALF